MPRVAEAVLVGNSRRVVHLMTNNAEQKKEHCLVKVGEYTVPLIGIPKDAGLEECDCCGDLVPLWKIRWNGKVMQCNKCDPT